MSRKIDPAGTYTAEDIRHMTMDEYAYVRQHLIEWSKDPSYKFTPYDSIDAQARRLAEQDIAEIEWRAGLIPMPQHLVELGTKTNLYTHRIIVKDLDKITCGAYNEGELGVPQMTDYEVVPLDEPFEETTVWGVKQPRRRLTAPAK